MTIEEYIKSKEKFHLMPFVTVYTAITELIKDGFIKENAFAKVGGSNVEASKFEPAWETSWRLHGEGNFSCNG